jgi:uncharacterized membrane protein YphA (DoxX/SURF4 family)
MKTILNRFTEFGTVYLRLALGIGFLSAVADRFGLWGAPGAKGVAWGSFDNFLTYTATLNPFLPSSLVPAVSWIATFAELILGLLLVLGFRIRETAALSGVMLLLFAIGMITGVGIKAPLDYSVFAASAGAFLLAAVGKSPLSIDALRRRA